MADIEDQVIKAIQSYAQSLQGETDKLVMMALADNMAPFLIEQLGLKQDWAILTLQSSVRGDIVDDIDYECDVRAAVQGALQYEQYVESQRPFRGPGVRRQALGTRLFTAWAEEESPIAIDEDLAVLVVNDAV